jgi:hypothetical protein
LYECITYENYDEAESFESHTGEPISSLSSGAVCARNRAKLFNWTGHDKLGMKLQDAGLIKKCTRHDKESRMTTNILRAFAFGWTKGRRSRQTETDDQGKRKYKKLKG